MNNKKERERWYLEIVRDTCAGFPAGDITDSEEPDFLIESSEHIVGIELTELYREHDVLNGRPMQAMERLTDSIVEEACTIHRGEGGPPLTVRVEFELGSRRLGRKQRTEIASKLAALVQQTPVEVDGYVELENDYENSDMFPEEITRIRIQRNRFRSRGLWTVPRVAFIPRLDVIHVQRRIDEKNKRVAVYREKSPEVWLVIVHSLHFSLASTFEYSDEVFLHKYDSEFDRTFLLDVFNRHCYELFAQG